MLLKASASSPPTGQARTFSFTSVLCSSPAFRISMTDKKSRSRPSLIVWVKARRRSTSSSPELSTSVNRRQRVAAAGTPAAFFREMPRKKFVTTTERRRSGCPNRRLPVRNIRVSVERSPAKRRWCPERDRQRLSLKSAFPSHGLRPFDRLPSRLQYAAPLLACRLQTVPRGTRHSQLTLFPPARSAGEPTSSVWLALPGSIGPRGRFMLSDNGPD
jgi:hypothetical protein